MKRLKEDIYHLKYALLILGLYCLFMQLHFGTVCPIKALFHFSCPGCGLTHATYYLFVGRWKDSLLANPTCILWLCTFFLFFYDRYRTELKIKPFPFLFIVASIVTLVWYLSWNFFFIVSIRESFFT